MAKEPKIRVAKQVGGIWTAVVDYSVVVPQPLASHDLVKEAKKSKSKRGLWALPAWLGSGE